MRGKLILVVLALPLLRITPAGAGKTYVIGGQYESVWDHPRRCGENIDPLNGNVRYLGSPPQVRGKLSIVFLSSFTSGITPAGAGKTIQIARNQLGIKDHPRRCGENAVTWLYVEPDGGSPPQVRGKPSPVVLSSKSYRITPAGAGKTTIHTLHSAPTKDHPRRCGENIVIIISHTNNIGSPPQVRGKPFSDSVAAVNTGITPAGAGKTFQRQCGGGEYWDHPRRCGEN